MAGPTSFRDLRIWQNAMQLAVDIYQLAGSLPPGEKPGLATDMQSRAVSIPSLIATGHKSGSRSGMTQACQEALVSTAELETLLIILGQLYPNVPSNDMLDQLDDVQQMLIAVIKRLQQSSNKPKKSL